MFALYRTPFTRSRFDFTIAVVQEVNLRCEWPVVMGKK